MISLAVQIITHQLLVCLLFLTSKYFVFVLHLLWCFSHYSCRPNLYSFAPCGLRGCKNGPAPFPGRMLYKATKPGLVSVLYLSMFLLCWCLFGPLFVLLVFIVCFLTFGCSSYVVITCQVNGKKDPSEQWVISLTVFGASITNLNEPLRAVATSAIMWVRS